MDSWSTTDYRRYVEENVINKLVKSLEDEAVEQMLTGKKAKIVMQQTGLSYKIGKPKYRRVCKRYYRRRDSKKKKQKAAQKKKSRN